LFLIRKTWSKSRKMKSLIKDIYMKQKILQFTLSIERKFYCKVEIWNWVVQNNWESETLGVVYKLRHALGGSGGSWRICDKPKFFFLKFVSREKRGFKNVVACFWVMPLGYPENFSRGGKNLEMVGIFFSENPSILTPKTPLDISLLHVSLRGISKHVVW